MTVSQLTVPVAGLPVHVFTNGNLGSVTGKVALLFFLHGRTGSATGVTPAVEAILKRVSEKRVYGQQAIKLVIATIVGYGILFTLRRLTCVYARISAIMEKDWWTAMPTPRGWMETSGTRELSLLVSPRLQCILTSAPSSIDMHGLYGA